MRALFAVSVFAAPAVAEPAKPDTPKAAIPPASVPLRFDRGSTTALIEPDVVPGIAGPVTARLLVPGPHPDAEPWPRGMVIAPPDVGDRNVLVPGTRGLPGRPASEKLLDRFVDGLERGIGDALRAIVPVPL